jgi:hypothetical protein
LSSAVVGAVLGYMNALVDDLCRSARACLWDESDQPCVVIPSCRALNSTREFMGVNGLIGGINRADRPWGHVKIRYQRASPRGEPLDSVVGPL